jgi:hypothetical protein
MGSSITSLRITFFELCEKHSKHPNSRDISLNDKNKCVWILVRLDPCGPKPLGVILRIIEIDH